jgi:hypothetical protein
MATLLLTIAILGTRTTIAPLVPAWHSARFQPMKDFEN